MRPANASGSMVDMVLELRSLLESGEWENSGVVVLLYERQRREFRERAGCDRCDGV